MKKSIAQAVILVVAGFLLAIAANALAPRQRKLALVGWYPNATKVREQVAASSERVAGATPAPVVAPAPVAATTATTATAAPVPQPAAKPAAPAKLPTANSQPPTPTNNQPPTTNTPDVLSRFQQHPDKAYIEIAYDDVAALHGKGVLFLDARRTAVYEQGHIAGARPFSVWESDLDEKVRKLFDERGDPASQAMPVVIYCSGGDCEDSHMLAQKLWGIQFNNLYVYKDGFPDWEKRRGAVHTGSNP